MNQDHVFGLAAYDSASCVLVLLMSSKPKTWEENHMTYVAMQWQMSVCNTGSKAATPFCDKQMSVLAAAGWQPGAMRTILGLK